MFGLSMRDFTMLAVGIVLGMYIIPAILSRAVPDGS